VEAAPGLGIGTLTLYAFSSDNWQRPSGEVAALMSLFGRHLRIETEDLIAQGVRLAVIGRRDRLPGFLVREIERAEQATREGRVLHLRVAVDYSARDTIVQAARRAAAGPPGSIDRDRFADLIGDALNEAGAVRDLDLLIRTGGEKRLSDFLLWEAAYAELLFTPVMWPDFGPSTLADAVTEYRARDRRFGRVVEQVAG